ncbi:flagellar hook-associated protein FlgL [Nesterenkonia populi]|uniref:flagellar hook-associated protein FlgL n=1 Tax=Nesterenkonia populi TaxID=1591087 RepID=UPI0011BEF4AF|nr:flagellar hook-associated protein FlgL [Nesterenkonia populi]
MAIQRVSSISMIAAADRNIQAAQQRLAAATNRASSLKEVEKPSDDPAAAAQAMELRAQQRANTQYSRNANNANSWLSTADSALSRGVNTIHQIRDVILSAANQGTMSADSREAHALQLEALREDLLDTANTQFMGRSVFAGTSDAASAFTADGTHQGVEGAEVSRKVGPNTTVRVDVDGAAAFGSGEDSIFAMLERAAADIRSGEPLQETLGELDGWFSRVQSVQASVGAQHATSLRQEEVLADDKVRLETRRSELEDADLASAALDLQAQEVAYQAALMASARVMQTSLMDYLR